MGDSHREPGWVCCGRRDFLGTLGATLGGMCFLDGLRGEERAPESPGKEGRPPLIRGAFLYPPPERLRAEGYWSWPGSGFDPEGRRRTYTGRLRAIEEKLRVRIALDEGPIDDAAGAARFIREVGESRPDGLLLIPFQKSHWAHVVRIIEETKLPTVVLATLGVLLSDHIVPLRGRPRVYLISALDDLEAVEYGARMVRTAAWMRGATILAIAGARPGEAVVPGLGTRIRTIPHERFVERFGRTPAEGAARDLAEDWMKGARGVVEPRPEDVLEAARSHLALKGIVEEERADAVMMDCLPGLRIPHRHPPPCMGFMKLRDEGIPAGCQADLPATLTLMLLQALFDRPGFQQNAAMDTERNLFFGAHCTSPSRMRGAGMPAEPYVLRSHAEAGWGCVPRVLFSPKQEVTMALYQPGQRPRMLIYTGEVVECPEVPPAGGCRTNVAMTVREVDDACDVKGMHQVIVYGNWTRKLRAFCQLTGIEAAS